MLGNLSCGMWPQSWWNHAPHLGLLRVCVRCSYLFSPQPLMQAASRPQSWLNHAPHLGLLRGGVLGSYLYSPQPLMQAASRPQSWLNHAPHLGLLRGGILGSDLCAPQPVLQAASGPLDVQLIALLGPVLPVHSAQYSRLDQTGLMVPCWEMSPCGSITEGRYMHRSAIASASTQQA